MGVITTDGSLSAIDFTIGNVYLTLNGVGFSELDAGNDFSMITVSSNALSSSAGNLITTTASVLDRMTLLNDTRTNKQILSIRGSGTAVSADYLATQNTSAQKLLTGITSAYDMSSYYNGTAQGTNTYSGTYPNSGLIFGRLTSSSSILNGFIQEIIIMPSNLTADIATYHSEINGYYSIY